MQFTAILQYALAWLPLLLVGLFLLHRGFKGRKINDHPVCRKCRFDLVGLSTDTDQPARCPECGTNLHPTQATPRRHPIIRGQRQRQPIKIILGLLLTLAAASILVWITYQPLTKFPWTTWMPDRVLAEMVDSPNAARADLVVREMLQRLHRDSLSPHSLRRATQQILRLQRDQKSPWLAIRGTLVEVGRAKGLVDDNQWKSYAENAFVISVQFPASIHENTPVYYDFHVTTRLGDSVPSAATRRSRLGAMIDERFRLLDASFTTRIGVHTTRPLRNFVRASNPPPGRHDGVIEFDIQIYNLADRHSDGNPTNLVARQSIPIPFVLEVVQVDDDPRTLASPREHEAAMRRCFDVEGLTMEAADPEVSGLFHRLHIVNPPVGYAFDVFVRTSEGETLLATISGAAGSDTYHWIARRGPVPGLDPATPVDVIFRPSIDVARSTDDLTEIWGREIVIEQLPLRVLID